MADLRISGKRLKDLQRAEARLQALEAAGVDNWDGYDDALEPYRQEIETEERRDELLDDIISELAGGAYEPSERGAGFAFHDEAIDKARAVLDTYGVTFKKED